MKINAEDITRIIKAQIQQYEDKITWDEVGTVVAVADGIATVYGLESCVYNEVLEFSTGIKGMALSLDKESVSVVVLGNGNLVQEGDSVKRTGGVVTVPVGEKLLGRVVDALGAPLDGKGPIEEEDRYPIERPAAGIMERKSVSYPMQTGIKAIDSMIPIGRGQRELLIGDRKTGKTAIAIDTILNQRHENVICVYVAIGQKQSTVAGIAEKLESKGAMDYSIIVAATASDSDALQYIAPYAGCSIAEYFMEKGRDVLIVYDDLSKHAVAYRTLSLLIRRPPGREAYPGDVFYLHSRLLERAARLTEELGGGSITALPIIETQGGDVSAYIPTNVISITDGQIFLDSELFHQGVIPAVDPGISVSRVGGNAQISAMRKISGKLKLIYSQYRELSSFAQFGNDLDNSTKRRLAQGERIVELLKQEETKSVPVEDQICILYGGIYDLYSRITLKDMKRFERFFCQYLRENKRELLDDIRNTGNLSEEKEQMLNETIDVVVQLFLSA
ncbi:MAG: F0F1 ATP synthase subunit alpha [Lachnospiraceae bacterium]